MSVERSELIRWAIAWALFVIALTTYQSIVPRMVLAGVGDSGRAADLNSWAQGAQAAATLAFAPTVGSLSDRYGRPLLFAVHACAIGSTTMAVALGFVNSAEWIVLSALYGSVSCADFVSRAALSTGDATSQASVYGVLAGTMAVGSLVGTQLSGAVASSNGAEASLLCGAGFAFAAALFACCLPDRRSPVNISEKDDRLEAGIAPDQCTAAVDPFANHTAQWALDLVIGLDALVGMSWQSLGVIYCATQYGLGAEAYAQVLTVFAAASIASNFGLLPLLRRAFESASSGRGGGQIEIISGSDLFSAGCGLALTGSGFACVATGSLPLLFLAATLSGSGSICTPGLVAARVSATGSAAIRSHGGMVQGRIARIQGLAMALGPLVFGSIYAHVGHRTPFVVASSLEFAAMVVVGWLSRNSNAPRKSDMAESLLAGVGEIPPGIMGA